MKKELIIIIPPGKLHDKEFLYTSAAEQLQKNREEISAIVPIKRSIDARSRSPIFRLVCEVYVNETPPDTERTIKYSPVKSKKEAVIIGSGPAGLYAALRLIELGIKPIIFERGKDVQTRRRDLRNIQQFGIVNPDSNYCFGEGGAGTYSDGKLYTRSTKRGDIKKTLSILVQHGADPDILIDAHPHIGSNKLPLLIKAVRETIIRCGGEVNFNSRVTDFVIKDNQVEGVVINDNKEVPCSALIIATGHSARDIFYILDRKGILLQSKQFALGVRIEHPQPLINEIQYHTKEIVDNLPAATYSLACNIGEKGVYSFCMCPGGIIIPAATAPEEIVVNGMSLSKRDSPFANAGFVVSVNPEDWQKYESQEPFGALLFQQEIEKLAFNVAANTQRAPAQRATDFMNNNISTTLPDSSYIPGLTPAPLHEVLPEFVVKGLKYALKDFNNKMKGYLTEEALMVGVESRTSSPIRVPRDKETYMHVNISGLFPAGEGAGYAGGIVSAAIDGENCANAVSIYLNTKVAV